MDSHFELSAFLVFFALYAVVHNATGATSPIGMSALVSAFHHLYGCSCISIVVEQPIGTPYFQNEP